MTATDELRRMLDERGFKWTGARQGATFWCGEHDLHWMAYETSDGKIDLCTSMINATPAEAVEATLGRDITGETSDGYHTFDELYHHRAVLFSVIVRDHADMAWKSKLHADGTMYEGMFIVGIETPSGQATYHYDIDPYWKMFDCKELERAPEWDGHTPSQAIERIATLGRGECHDLAETPNYRDKTDFKCSACGYEYSSIGGFGCDCGDEPDFNYCPNCGRRVAKVVSE